MTTKPGCETEGVKTYICKTCGATKEEKLSALGHDFAVTETKAATCTEDGYKTLTCTRCSAVAVESLPALGHSCDEGKVTTAPAISRRA